jgi:hypothetical protein
MKIVSAMEKCFYSDAVESKREKNEFLIFRNERLSFQVVYSAELSEKRGTSPTWHPVRLEGELAKYATDLRSMTQGRGSYTTKFERYEEVPPQAQEKIIKEAKENKA